ncbi:MAG: hypothetical protein LUF30_12190, partial [Lachnospiraceae bacterium]|nr:hypothetical protein [Lachnospiraceae bacterium]
MKQLDPTRYTTSGINGLMAASDRMGEIMCQATGMSPDQLAAMMSPEQAGENADMERGRMEVGGADEVNGMAAVMVSPLADAIATCPLMDEMIGVFAGVKDICGYIYLTSLQEVADLRPPTR